MRKVIRSASLVDPREEHGFGESLLKRRLLIQRHVLCFGQEFGIKATVFGQIE